LGVAARRECGGPTGAGIVNFGMSSALYRASTADTGLTTTAPASIGAQTATSAIALVGLS
jgi:hypothetical protein